jgi:hypothetical protein
VQFRVVQSSWFHVIWRLCIFVLSGIAGGSTSVFAVGWKAVHFFA